MMNGALIRAACILWLLAVLQSCSGQLSKPVGTDSQVDIAGNKFLQRHSYQDEEQAMERSDEVVLEGQCDANLALKWMTEVSSSIYATPLIHDLYSDGQLDIIVPSFVHYLEVVEGSNGARAMSDSWPAHHRSFMHASPLLFDLDRDNILDILVATGDGDIYAYKDTGERLDMSMHVPPLDVHKGWYEGLADDFIDHSHPDVGAANENHPSPEARAEAGKSETSRSDGSMKGPQRRLLQGDEQLAEELKRGGWDPFSVDAMAGAEDWGNARVDMDGLGGADDWPEEPTPTPAYGDYQDPYVRSIDSAWADEGFYTAPHPKPQFVAVDSHILGTPAIGDIDNDGREDLIVAASYYFDQDYYSRPDRRAELGKDVDTAKYIAGGIVAFDLLTQKIKWAQHLDLSTDHTQFRAYVYASPTLVDLDGDGNLEIIIGTSMGFLYVLDHKGETKPGWPIQMGEIQAQVAVADLYRNNSMQIVAVDTRGNVAVFDKDGKELWERHLGTQISQAATFGDVNRDGLLEIFVGGANGGVYVLNPNTGEDMPHFPFFTQGKIMAPILPTKVRPSISFQLIVPSYDGHLYIIDAFSGCADVVDVGETAYAMVLAEDLDNNGRLDLLLATMNGNLYAFETVEPTDPHAVWPAQTPAQGQFATRLAGFSVTASQASRQPRDVRGQSMQVKFEISDPPSLYNRNFTAGPYVVAIRLQGVSVAEMNSGELPVIGTTDTYQQPGIYTLQVPCPRSRATASVHVEVTNRWGVKVVDTFSLSFHMHFHRLLKWVLAAPFLAACLAVLAQHTEDLGLGLPSFQ